MTTHYPDRCFAFDQFGPLSIRPVHGASWAARNRPARLPATYHRTHGIRYFHGCYSPADDQLWGVMRARKGADHTLAALRSIRAARPGGYRLYVILDNLSANKTPTIRRWAGRTNVELCFTPTNASWANPIEPQFGPVRTFVMGGSDHPSHSVLAHRMQDYLRWRNSNARHPDILAAPSREDRPREWVQLEPIRTTATRAANAVGTHRRGPTVQLADTASTEHRRAPQAQSAGTALAGTRPFRLAPTSRTDQHQAHESATEARPPSQTGSYMAIVWAMAGEAGLAPAFTLEYDVQPQDVRELVVATPRVKDKLTIALLTAMLSGLVAVGFTAITIALNYHSAVFSATGAPGGIYVADLALWLVTAFLAWAAWQRTPERLTRLTIKKTPEFQGGPLLRSRQAASERSGSTEPKSSIPGPPSTRSGRQRALSTYSISTATSWQYCRSAPSTALICSRHCAPS